MAHGNCKLCGSVGDLKLSHFIPKFVGRWVKETSATGFIRLSRDINKRSQDIVKDYWLCGDCEQLFSGWEREFANKIFYPFVKCETDTAIYGDWLAKFCASISWRTLSYMRHLNERGDSEQGRKEERVLSGLADFILGKKTNPGIYEQHLFPLEPIETTSAKVPANINRYFLRNMHMDILASDTGELMVYTKFPKFIVLGLAGHSQSKLMRASKVSISGGKISPKSYYLPDGFAQYMFEKAKKVTEFYKSMAPAQHDMIKKTLMKAPDRAASSGTFEAFRHDIEMFGRKAFLPEDRDGSE